MRNRFWEAAKPAASHGGVQWAQTEAEARRRPVCRDDARRSEAGSGRTDGFSVVCRSPLRVCPQQGEMRPEQAAEKGVVR